MPTKVCLVKAMVFPVVMYGCENWNIKKAERQRIDAFELWFWIRLLRVPWTARRSNQSILRKSVLNIHWKDWCWSWSSNTLATWCKELIHWKRPWCWERLKVGGEGDNRGWDGWMASRTQWTWVWVAPGVGDGQESLVCCSPWCHKESDTTEWLNWTEEFPWAQAFNDLVKFQLYIKLGEGRRPGKFLVSYFSMWNYYMTPLWSSLEGALFWDESENVTSSFWGSLGHPYPQFFPIPPPPGSNFSKSFLPISPQANILVEPSSLFSPGSYPTQSWP